MTAGTHPPAGTATGSAPWQASLHPADIPAWLPALAAARGAGKPLGYLARNSRSFRFAARFLPDERAAEAAEVYAFCRFTDDLVDEPGGLPAEAVEERLDEWLGLARTAYCGGTTGLPLLDRPLGEMGRRGVPFDYAARLVEGMRMDIRPRLYRTSAELETYTWRVAGVVGCWLTELSGIRSPWVLSRAADLGHAMQLTNILRDVGEDWRRGRLYLPLEALSRHGLDPEDIGRCCLRPGNLPPGWRDLIEDLLEEAQGRYRSAFAGIPYLPAYFQRPVLVAALAYRGIHDALRANGYDNLHRRAATTSAAKAAAGLRALWILPSLRTLYASSRPPPVREAVARGCYGC